MTTTPLNQTAGRPARSIASRLGRLLSCAMLAMAVTAAVPASEALAGDVVILNGPRAQSWHTEVSRQNKARMARDLSQIPADATLILPDRLLTPAELDQLQKLPASVKILAIGKSAYSTNGKSPARTLGVGKHFQYIPLLYPAWLKYDMKKYEEIARWAAQNNAQGIGVFSLTHTLPERSEQPNFEVVRDVFGAYESWKKKETLDAPRSPGLKQTPTVLFMHKNDTVRTGPEDAVAWAKKLSANTLSVEVSRVRTRGVYPSKFTQHEELEYQGRMIKPENDLDYLPRLLAAAKEADVAVHANIMTKHTMYTTRPDERQVMASDFASGKDPEREAPCPISGARHYDDMAAIVEELLQLYPQLVAIELDEPRIYNRNWTDWACFCKGCQQLFKERYGYDLTPANVIDTPQFEDDEPDKRNNRKNAKQTINSDFAQFRTWMMNELIIEKFRRAINRVKPDTALIVWQPRTYEAFGFSPSSILYGVSVFGPEYMDGPGSPRYLNHPDAFSPRFERIAQIVNAQNNEKHELSAEIARVDLFHLARPLFWGEAEDGSKWSLLTQTLDERVMYVAFDPTTARNESGELMKTILEWISR